MQGVAGHAGAAGGFFALFFHHLVEAVERVAGAADLGDHPRGHLVQLRGGALDLQVIDAGFQRCQLRLRRFHRHIARAQQLLVRRLGGSELRAVLDQLALHGLQPQRLLTGQIVIAGAEVGGRLRAQLALLLLQAFHLRHQPLA